MPTQVTSSVKPTLEEIHEQCESSMDLLPQSIINALMLFFRAHDERVARLCAVEKAVQKCFECDGTQVMKLEKLPYKITCPYCAPVRLALMGS